VDERFLGPEQSKAWQQDKLHKVSSNAVMILNDPEGKALVVKANYKPYWNFPGGSIDKDETPEAAARREVFEEVRIKIDPGSSRFVAFVFEHVDTKTRHRFIFESSITPQQIGAIVLQAAEIEDYDFVTKQQVKSEDRTYAPAVKNWAHETLAYYNEQT
jgi:8-oxo-dGTP diphosphatase